MSDAADPIPPAPPVPQAWAPPAAPPFGTPAGYAPRVTYAPPPGYTGPYGNASSPAVVQAAAPVAGRTVVGTVALVVALVAAVVAPLGVALAAFNIGLGAGRELALRPFGADFDWSVLTPVRDWVLIAELSFWVGTALGVWAIVQGIIAIATDRGRRAGIAAVVIGVLGAILFATALQAALTAGLAAGTGIGG